MVGRFDHLNKIISPVNSRMISELLNHKKLRYPKVIELDLTSECNYSCPFCIDENVLVEKHVMKFDLLMTLIKEFGNNGVQGVILIGGGEPLMHPRFKDVLKLLHDEGISIGITTNGSLINRYFDEIRQYVSWIRVSIDAGTKDTYSTMKSPRTSHKLDDVLSNVKILSENFDGSIGFSFIISQDNYNEIFEAIEIAMLNNFDYIQFKPLINSKTKKFVTLTSDVINESKKQINEGVNKYSSYIKIIVTDSMDMVFKEAKTLDIDRRKQCWAKEYRTLISPHGVYVCPYHRGDKTKKIGDVNHDSLVDIWNADLKEEMYKRMNVHSECDFYCIRSKVNTFLDSVTTSEYLELVDSKSKGIFENISNNVKFI